MSKKMLSKMNDITIIAILSWWPILLWPIINSFEAKHTKDSKDFACSTLSLCHLSRAILSRKPTLGAGPNFYWRKVRIGRKSNFRQKFYFLKFFLSILVPGTKIFWYPVPNFGTRYQFFGTRYQKNFGTRCARPPIFRIKITWFQLHQLNHSSAFISFRYV